MKQYIISIIFSIFLLSIFLVPVFSELHADTKLVFCNTGIPNDKGQFVNTDGTSNECGWSELVKLVQVVIRFLIVDIGIPATSVIFAYAGFEILTAGGNAGQLKKGKQMFQQVLVGFVIALSAWAIVNTILVALVCNNLSGQQCDYSLLK